MCRVECRSGVGTRRLACTVSATMQQHSSTAAAQQAATAGCHAAHLVRCDHVGVRDAHRQEWLTRQVVGFARLHRWQGWAGKVRVTAQPGWGVQHAAAMAQTAAARWPVLHVAHRYAATAAQLAPCRTVPLAVAFSRTCNLLSQAPAPCFLTHLHPAVHNLHGHNRSAPPAAIYLAIAWRRQRRAGTLSDQAGTATPCRPTLPHPAEAPQHAHRPEGLQPARAPSMCVYCNTG